MGVYGNSQHAVIVFRNTPEEPFDFSIIRIRCSQCRPRHNRLNPFSLNHAFFHSFERVPSVFQPRQPHETLSSNKYALTNSRAMTGLASSGPKTEHPGHFAWGVAF